VTTDGQKVAPRGLAGVVAASTELSLVEDGNLQYRGYAIEDLAANAQYEEVAYLLLNGELPDGEQLRSFSDELAANRPLSPLLADVLAQTARGTAMDVLRTVVSASAVDDPDEGDNGRDVEYRKSIRLTARMPTILAAYIRRRRGEDPVEPDPAEGHAESFVRMAGLEEAHPRAAEILNTCFILQAEHGLNASTFAARITAATLADMHAAVTAALGALKGSLHGGATDGTMEMLDEIRSLERVPQFVEEGFARKYKFPGFGHRVYVTRDPRAAILRRFARELARSTARDGMPPYFDIQERLVDEVNARRQFPVNVDYYAATTYTYLGIPADLGTSIFAIGRMAGWCAHVMEQHADNRLIRPESEYTGPPARPWVPLAER
jgi:citrate synthase